MMTDEEFAEALAEALETDKDNTVDVAKELMGDALTDDEREYLY